MNQWSDRATRAPAVLIDPYEDFETAIRLEQGVGPALWHPVYIRLRAGMNGTQGYSAAARRVLRLQARQPDRVAIGTDSRAILDRLIAREAAGSGNVHHLRYLFVYRPAHLAYAPLQSGPAQGGADICDVVQVGVAVPRSIVDNTPLPDLSPTQPPDPQTQRPDIVVTAVIDDFIGIAHERFRAAPTRTRIRHHWVQGVETLTPANGTRSVAIGQEFDAADIDALLAQSPSEPAFYRALNARMFEQSTETPDALISGLRTLFDVALADQGAGKEDGIERAGTRAAAFIEDRLSQLTPRARQAVDQVTSAARNVFQGLLSDSPPQDPEDGFAPVVDAIRAQPQLKFEERRYRRPIGFNETHGTHVLDLAGGAPMGSLGVHDRPLVSVELPALATIETNGARLDTFVLQAVQRILGWVDNWRLADGTKARVGVVINLSYGIAAGPKTGRGFLEREIARLLDARNSEGLPSKIVLPAGNTYRSHLTGALSVPQGQARSVDWRVLPQDYSSSYLELRLPASVDCELTLTPPGGPADTIPLPPAGEGVVREWRRQNQVLGAIYAQPSPTEAGITRVVIALAPSTRHGPGRQSCPAGAYGVSLRNTGSGPDETHIDVTLDVQRDDTPTGFPIHGRQSYLEDAGIGARDRVTRDFAAPHRTSAIKWSGTLSAYATHASDNVFVVGGAYPDDRAAGSDANDRQPARYASAGPSRGAQSRHPDMAAVSEQGRMIGGVLAAGTFSGAGSVFSGTSSAAPQIARAMVDVLQGSTLPRDKTAILDAVLGPSRPVSMDPQLGYGLPPRTYQADGRAIRR